jgi:hypothetical protein
VRAAANLDRMRIDERTIFFEWLVLALVIVGVQLSGRTEFAKVDWYKNSPSVWAEQYQKTSDE